MTDCDLDEALKPLLAKAGSLTDAMTRVDAQLEAAEKALVESGCKVEEWIAVHRENAARPEGITKPVVRVSQLGWTTIGSGAEWKFAVKSSLFISDGTGDVFLKDDSDPVPLGAVDLEGRVVAWGKLPALLRALDRRMAELLGLTKWVT